MNLGPLSSTDESSTRTWYTFDVVDTVRGLISIEVSDVTFVYIQVDDIVQPMRCLGVNHVTFVYKLVNDTLETTVGLMDQRQFECNSSTALPVNNAVRRPTG